MTLRRRTWLRWTAAAAAARAVGASALSARPLTLVIPFAPGGASDAVVRALADPLGQALGRTVLAENRGGAGGLIAAAAVGRAPADGATLLYGNQGQMVVARHLFPGSGPDPLTLLVPVALTARTQFLLVVPPESSHADAAALLRAARREAPRFGIPGFGTPPHLAAALLGELGGVVVEMVPYQGSAPLMVDLMAGRTDAAFDNVASSLPHVRAGKLRALAVSGVRRNAALPGTPTLAEAGLGGYAYEAWQGVFAPAGTPAEVLDMLARGLRTALVDPAAAARLQALGIEIASPDDAGPDALRALIARDTARWEPLVRKGVVRAG